jgi:hypothetical protein
MPIEATNVGKTEENEKGFNQDIAGRYVQTVLW